MTYWLEVMRLPWLCKIKLCQPSKIVKVYDGIFLYEEKRNKPPLRFIKVNVRCKYCNRPPVDRWIDEKEVKG